MENSHISKNDNFQVFTFFENKIIKSFDKKFYLRIIFKYYPISVNI